MAPYVPNASGGGGSYSRRVPTFKQIDLERGTELFRKQLEGTVNKNQSSQPSVKGGLPPHLLRQQSEKNPLAAKTDASTDCRGVSGASPSNGQHEGAYIRQDQSQDHSPEAPSAHGDAHRQSMATIFEVPSSEQPTQQQPLRARPIKIHPAREPWPTDLKSIATYQASSTPCYTPVQQQRHGGTRDRDNLDIEPAKHGFSASGWAGGTQEVQHQFHNEQPQSHSEQPALPPTGGIRLSVNAYGDWSQFDRKDREQQQFNTSELEKVKTRTWRPRHSCDLLSQDLPDSVASSLGFNDSNHDSPIANGALVCSDIRNTVGGELDLIPKVHGEGFYNKNRWVEYPDESKALEWRPTYCQLWVKEMENEDWPVAIFLKMKNMPHEECDVQTSDGWLMAPVEYPDTHINPAELKNDQHHGATSRRLNGNACLKIAANYRRLKRRVDEREGEVKWEPIGDDTSIASPPDHVFEKPIGQRNSQSTSQPTRSYVNRLPVMKSEQRIHRPERVIHHRHYGTITHLPRTYTPKPPPTYLKICCFLRPAEESDIPQILDIYNWEVAHGMQALDTKPLCLKDMERVFKQCKDAKTPIIVAIAGTSTEAKARREPTVAPRGRYETGQQGPQQPSQYPENDKVIGFAYVSILSPGLAGDVHYNVGRFEGQIHLYVTHECRRKGVGRALLQQTTIFCSRHAGYHAQNYEWHDPEKTPTYDDAFYNSRSYSRIFVEVASRAKDDSDTLWVSKFLDEENFSCVSTKDKARKLGYGEAGRLLDCLVWQHDCQDLDKMKENDPKRG